MHILSPAIVLSVRAHGEHGAVARALTPEDGVQPGYVRGGRSRALRPVLQPGNRVRGEWRARTDSQLAALTVELVESCAPLYTEPLPAAAIEWVSALTVTTLPEGQPYRTLYDALGAMIAAVAAAPAARGWAGLVARYELLVLAELGFGLALDVCVVTGARVDLSFVSPRSGGAVSRMAANGYEARLMPLPPFLANGGEAPDWPSIFDAFAVTGHFIERDLMTGRAAEALAGRERLLERLRRAAGWGMGSGA
ncbi:DNA repair protein RecO [Sphingomonas sp.]|uniref:DNA repair protein RecO n=1 Tax=Sphingomonas sp. TaxID=28214 RepID=UPI002CF45550|nr:DNA repair protein RecO [Sphingomonas sp.]HTG39713.1 DNA repair protein RecO [Sphingomonas sp.]